MASLPLSEQRCSAFSPLLFQALDAVLSHSRSSLATSMWPPFTAEWRGMFSSPLRVRGDIPFSSSRRVID